MAARSMWKGSISFGLVQIPVALYPAEHTKELSFHLLARADLSPIHFKRVSASTGKEIDYKDEDDRKWAARLRPAGRWILRGLASMT